MTSIRPGAPNSETDRVMVRFAWSPPSGRVMAAYRAEVIRHEPEGRREVCRLIELVEIQRDGSGSEISDDVLRGLIGQCARVPREALSRDMILPLKIATLTGGLRRPYFFNEQWAMINEAMINEQCS